MDSSTPSADVVRSDAEIASEMAVVERLYRDVLAREIDEVGAAIWHERIATGESSGAEAEADLRQSPEFLLGRTGFYDRVHRARMAWAATLDHWDVLLDIGGSAPHCPDGALLELGYPGRPTELHILDRPEDEQFHGRPSYDQTEDRVHDWGTISFHHGSAERIDDVPPLAGKKFDGIFMGQTIEHIEVDALPEVLAFVRHRLRRGGRFVFDTPNRAITELVMGTAYLTDDHTHEYTPDEMREVLARHHLVVTRQVGIVPMPRSLANRQFDPFETPDDAPLSDDPADCFIFAFECRPMPWATRARRLARRVARGVRRRVRERFG